MEEELRDLDRKVKQLKLDYDRYFLGTRPREPIRLRLDVDKLIVVYGSSPIQNTALRFRFNSICSRYHALKRQWIETVRKIEAGTYERHRFKAALHERERGIVDDSPAADRDSGPADLFEEYRDARLACGQDVAKISREKIERTLEKQRNALRERYGADAEFRFRVVVEEGRAKLKARRVG